MSILNKLGGMIRVDWTRSQTTSNGVVDIVFLQKNEMMGT